MRGWWRRRRAKRLPHSTPGVAANDSANTLREEREARIYSGMLTLQPRSSLGRPEVPPIVRLVGFAGRDDTVCINQGDDAKKAYR